MLRSKTCSSFNWLAISIMGLQLCLAKSRLTFAVDLFPCKVGVREVDSLRFHF